MQLGCFLYGQIAANEAQKMQSDATGLKNLHWKVLVMPEHGLSRSAAKGTHGHDNDNHNDKLLQGSQFLHSMSA